MTERQIDHIVHMVADLDTAAANYEAMGFTLTPRAHHDWGTANRLVQFPDNSFIEILEIERPELIPEFDSKETPPRFSFGAYNRGFLTDGEGLSMLVLSGNDSRGDAKRFADAGLGGYAPFDFERQARQPDGSEVTVGFSLAFATSEEMPRAACFTCHNRFPQNFWKPRYQQHANGAEGIAEVVMVSAEPDKQRQFFQSFTGVQPVVEEDGIAYRVGPHRFSIMTPASYAARFGQPAPSLEQGPRFAALVVSGQSLVSGITPAADAHGMLITKQASSAAAA